MLCIKKRDGRTDGRTTQKQYKKKTLRELGHFFVVVFILIK